MNCSIIITNTQTENNTMNSFNKKKNMITISKVTGIFLFILVVFSSCIKDGLDECPEGTVRIHLFVEKFRNKSQNPLDDRELDFGQRVSHIRYYLYKDGKLKEQEVLEKFKTIAKDSYTFDFNQLDFGDYKLVVVANSAKKALTGDGIDADKLLLTYPGSADTEDFFTAVFPFKVSSNAPAEYNVGLLRTQGVIRYTFKNMPADVTGIGVVMRNVSSLKWVTGDYAENCEANRTFTVIKQVNRKSNEEEQEYVIGTFPTLRNQKSAYYLSLFRGRDAEPYYQQMITDTLTVLRNQLLDITATFSGGSFDFEVDINNEWNGGSDGGQIGIE